MNSADGLEAGDPAAIEHGLPAATIADTGQARSREAPHREPGRQPFATIEEIGAALHARPRIDVDVSESQRRALFNRVQQQWASLGATEPYWSVLTHEEFRAANLDDAAILRFFQSGAEHAALIEAFCGRTQTPGPRGRCVELGCGVGRVTQQLAERFDHLLAVDISEGNLREAQIRSQAAGIRNIEFMLLESPGDLRGIGSYDFLYSAIVLQHNPPPIQKYLLDVLLQKLRPGGAFLFQTQTYCPDYQFVVDDFLNTPLHTMDMHSLPMHEVLMLIEKHEHRIREVIEDNWTGRLGSHTFFGLARKPRRGVAAWLAGA